MSDHNNPFILPITRQNMPSNRVWIKWQGDADAIKSLAYRLWVLNFWLSLFFWKIENDLMHNLQQDCFYNSGIVTMCSQKGVSNYSDGSDDLFLPFSIRDCWQHQWWWATIYTILTWFRVWSTCFSAMMSSVTSKYQKLHMSSWILVWGSWNMTITLRKKRGWFFRV